LSWPIWALVIGNTGRTSTVASEIPTASQTSVRPDSGVRRGSGLRRDLHAAKASE
jgi:hypothetical protein